MSGLRKLDRREFLGVMSSAAAAAFIPRHLMGGSQFVPPSDKITIGFIGTGTQGIRQLMQALPHPEIHIAAVCDVNKDSTDYLEWYQDELRGKIRQFLDEPSWGEGVQGCRAGRDVGKEIVETYYAKNAPSGTYTGTPAYRDFRDLLAEETDLDAIYIMTPEHLHATIAIAGMKAGKHVITHKPLANVLYEARLAKEVAEETKVATHMFCSADSETTPLLTEWLQDGAIGPVREVHNWSTRPFWPQGMADYPGETMPVPEGFDWDLWLGPVPHRPYHPSYTHGVFRGWYDFGTGALGDMGNYSFYQIFKMLGLTAPVSAEASCSQTWTIDPGYWIRQENNVSYPEVSNVHFEFQAREGMPPVSLHWYDGNMKPPTPEELKIDKRDMPDEGMLLVGDNGKILAGFNGGSPRILPEEKMRAYQLPPETLPRPIDEFDQWIRACKGGEPSDARFEVVNAISETICLGTIAQRTGKRLEWDSGNMTITNVPEANQHLRRKYRTGWEL
ncbi:MAG TPA: Gfo/Idh/MocA family oxidoreductase [bacterium]|nr:Gfo/Idh/MocA family oxidoreductase [bacterium]